jgi:hypothetical protein
MGSHVHIIIPLRSKCFITKLTLERFISFNIENASRDCTKGKLVRKRRTKRKNNIKTDESFQCKLCNKTFRSQGYYNVHMRTHQKDLPFKCSHWKDSSVLILFFRFVLLFLTSFPFVQSRDAFSDVKSGNSEVD